MNPCANEFVVNDVRIGRMLAFVFILLITRDSAFVVRRLFVASFVLTHFRGLWHVVVAKM